MSKIIEFLEGRPVRVTPFSSLRMTNVWKYGRLRLEHQHGYIQWLFPTTEKSKYNRHAPILSQEDIEGIWRRPELQANILKSLSVMLRFYGLEMDEKEGKVRIAQVEPRYWPPTQHNFLRITRILKCLRICGLNEYAEALWYALVKLGQIPEETWAHWRSIVGR